MLEGITGGTAEYAGHYKGVFMKYGLWLKGFGAACVLNGALVNIVAADNIQATVHNLGASATHTTNPNGGAPNRFDGTEEVCVFCHTPHGGDTSAAVPLWNRKLNNPASYLTYDQLGTSTFDAQVAPVGSVTIACLSCHDGTQAIDSVINAPGSGGYNPLGKGMQGSWSGSDQSGGILISGIIQNIGTDLRNDHPVGMQYAGGGITADNPTPPKGETTDPDFNPVSVRTSNDGRKLWWLDTNSNNRRDMQGDVVLYTRGPQLGGGYTGQSKDEPFVECASCHNPHTAENATFLRVSNTGSRLCLTCHAK